jgi:hypothetical protein
MHRIWPTNYTIIAKKSKEVAFNKEGPMRVWIHIRYSLAAVLFYCALMSGNALAVWSNNPEVNTAVTNLTGAGAKPAITGDGSGGAIIAWMSATNDIHVQRIDADGNLQWGGAGKALTGDGNNYNPRIATDMSGGAFVVWQKGSAGDGIYVQQVNGAGDEQWSTGGEFILMNNDELSGSHRNPRIVSDGRNGAIVVWEDSRTAESTGFDIYAQRFHTDIDGEDIYYEEYWGATGQPICVASADQLNPQILSDSSGGAVFVWQDQRLGKWKIMALRADVETGNPIIGGGWSNDGNPVSFSDDKDHEKPQLISDGSGGAIITWQVGDDGSGGIYAQRISMGADYPWLVNQFELIVSSGPNKLQAPQIISDGDGVAIISWLGVNSSNGSSTGIYAQRVNGSGVVQWTANGVTVASPAAIDTGDPPQMVSDGSNGAVITWADRRNGTDLNIYARRIDGSGSTQWSADGIEVSTATSDQQLPRIIPDGSGGAIIAWQDQRSADGGIYAQKVLPDGTLPVVLLAPTVTTAAASIITATSATGGGEVTSDGGSAVTDRGICWGSSPDPVKWSGNYISADSGAGSFTGLITGLTANTTYHARAYATNSIGTSYGSDITFTTNNKYGLNISFAGTGRGNVSWGVTTCGSACAFLVDPNTTANLQASTLPFYSFTSWAGACNGTFTQCSVLMNSDNRNVTATFTLDAANSVRIKLPTEKRYTSVTSAIQAAQNGTAVIDTWGCELIDNPTFNRGTFTLNGGWDYTYSNQNGATTINGTVTVEKGSLTVEKLAIR